MHTHDETPPCPEGLRGLRPCLQAVLFVGAECVGAPFPLRKTTTGERQPPAQVSCGQRQDGIPGFPTSDSMKRVHFVNHKDPP